MVTYWDSMHINNNYSKKINDPGSISRCGDTLERLGTNSQFVLDLLYSNIAPAAYLES